jgi:hypothetical protein
VTKLALAAGVTVDYGVGDAGLARDQPHASRGSSPASREAHGARKQVIPPAASPAHHGTVSQRSPNSMLTRRQQETKRVVNTFL